MSEDNSNSLIPGKYGVLSPFAKFAWCMIGLVVVSVIALFVLNFDFARLLGASHFINKARQAITAKDWPAAVEAIKHVQGRDRDRADFLRLLADFLEVTQTEPALLDATLDKMNARGLMQPHDLVWACRLRLVSGQIEAARKAFERIPVIAKPSLENFKLNIAILKEEGRTVEGLAEEERMLRSFPYEPEIVLRRAAKDLQGSFPELQDAAMQDLWNLAKEKNEYGLKAIQLLRQQGNLTLVETTRLLALADKQPDITPAERLTIVSALMRLDPTQRKELLDAQVERYRKAAMPVTCQLASWLAQEKEVDRLMALAPVSATSKNWLLESPELFPLLALGMAEQARWAELLALLDKRKQLPVSKIKAASWRALAAKNLNGGDFKEARLHLEEAIREGNTENNAQAIFEAARLAEDWGMPDLALKAYEGLALRGSPQEVGLLEKSLQVAFTLKDSGDLLRISEKLCKARPASLLLAHRRDYLHLLVGKEIETTPRGGNGIEAKPTQSNDSAQLVEVLQAYRLRDDAKLSDLINRMQRTDSEMSPGERAVYAGILAERGEAIKAYEMAEKIRPELLLKEEIIFLNKAL